LAICAIICAVLLQKQAQYSVLLSGQRAKRQEYGTPEVEYSVFYLDISWGELPQCF